MFKSIMGAISSSITTTSERLFGKSTDNSVSSATNFVEAIKSEGEALYNGASAVVKVGSTVLAVGAAMLAVGPLVGVGVSLAGTLGVVNGTLGLFTLSSATVATVQTMAIEGAVFLVRHSTQAVLGGGLVGGIYNGRTLLEGISEAAYAVKKTADAVSHLAHAAIDGTKVVVYTTAAVGVKTVEILTRLAGSDQDGFGDNTVTFLNEVIDLGKDDAELGQKIEKLYEDQDALNNAIAVTNEAISKLKGDNEITAAVKAGHNVVRATLQKQQADLNVREDDLAHREDMLKDWNVLTQEEVISPTTPTLTESVIAELITPADIQQPEAEILGNGDVWDSIDLSSSAAA